MPFLGKAEHDMEYYLGHINYFHYNNLEVEGQNRPIVFTEKSVNNVCR